jgi:hypothetical protein
MSTPWKDVVTGLNPVRSTVSGSAVTITSLGGDPHTNAVAAAVAAHYAQLAERPRVTAQTLRSLVGRKVSVLCRQEGALGHIAVQTIVGTVCEGTRGLMILPKGSRTRGYSLDPAAVLDVEPGYTAEEILTRRAKAVRARMPDLARLTPEHLEELPLRGSRVTLAVFGTYRFPAGPIHGALWLLHSYDPEADIAEGVLIVPPGAAESEHGSIYGKSLLRMNLGVVTGFAPISLADALALIDAEYEDVLTRLKPAGTSTTPEDPRLAAA